MSQPSNSVRRESDTLIVENALASARVSLFGGHVLSFIPKEDHRERLWFSDKAILDGSKAIRGGIPICWPWFGNHENTAFPVHGFARTSMWQLNSAEDTDSGTVIVLQLDSSNRFGACSEIRLTLTLTIGRSLTLTLKSDNLSAKDFSFTCALHSYFRVSHIGSVSLEGLAGKYADKTQQSLECDTPSPYLIVNETDRIHQCAAPQVYLLDNGSKSLIEFRGHDSIVVWNPGRQKCKAMADMSEHGYERMLCVESAMTRPVTLRAGESHSLEQIIY